jgi:hypothetical protein
MRVSKKNKKKNKKFTSDQTAPEHHTTGWFFLASGSPRARGVCSNSSSHSRSGRSTPALCVAVDWYPPMKR